MSRDQNPAVNEAERIVRRAGWLAPSDGGRGRELRTRWTMVRWFAWRQGVTVRRGRRWWMHLRWTVFPKDGFLLGLYIYRDDDGERCVDVGVWPFLWELGVGDWPRPKDGMLP